MTDENSTEYQSAAPEDYDENNRLFTLNQSNIAMDIDVVDDDLRKLDLSNVNGHISQSSIADDNGSNDEQNNEVVFRRGNPELNKSFDIIPQVKNDEDSAADSISDSHAANNDVLDTTVDLSTQNDQFDENPSQDLNTVTTVNDIDTPEIAQPLVSNEFSPESPYVIPPPQENVRPSSPNPIETVTTFAKNMKLNVQKTSVVQEPPVLTSSADKTFDTNTFVLKRKDRRKLPIMNTENNFNMTIEESPPDICAKQSPLNTPSIPLNTTVSSRPAAATPSSQQPVIDPTRIM